MIFTGIVAAVCALFLYPNIVLTENVPNLPPPTTPLPNGNTFCCNQTHIR